LRTPRFLFTADRNSSTDLIAEALERGVPISILLDANETHHLLKVLRVKEQDPVELLEVSSKESFSGYYDGLLNSRASIAITSRLKTTVPAANVELLVAMPENAAADLIVEKSAEFGARSVTFFFAERSQKGSRLEKTMSRLERFQRIALAALKQCGGVILPSFAVRNSLEEALADVSSSQGNRFIALAPSLDPQSPEIINLFTALSGRLKPAGLHLENLGENADFLVLIGPEGGWSAAEVSQTRASGFLPVTLGPTTLRTETAAISVLALVSAFSSQK